MLTLESYAAFLANAKINDDGAKGKALEVALRDYIQPRSKRVGVTSNKTWYGDIRRRVDNGNGYNWEKLEIKSSCGELAIVDVESASDTDTLIHKMLPKADYILYCPEIASNIPLEEQTFVFTRDEFIAMATSYSGRGAMVRVKKGTNGGYRLSFQSFQSDTRPKASKPIASHIWECCYNQPTVKEWLEGERG